MLTKTLSWCLSYQYTYQWCGQSSQLQTVEEKLLTYCSEVGLM